MPVHSKDSSVLLSKFLVITHIYPESLCAIAWPIIIVMVMVLVIGNLSSPVTVAMHEILHWLCEWNLLVNSRPFVDCDFEFDLFCLIGELCDKSCRAKDNRTHCWGPGPSNCQKSVDLSLFSSSLLSSLFKADSCFSLGLFKICYFHWLMMRPSRTSGGYTEGHTAMYLHEINQHLDYFMTISLIFAHLVIAVGFFWKNFI